MSDELNPELELAAIILTAWEDRRLVGDAASVDELLAGLRVSRPEVEVYRARNQRAVVKGLARLPVPLKLTAAESKRQHFDLSDLPHLEASVRFHDAEGRTELATGELLYCLARTDDTLLVAAIRAMLLARTIDPGDSAVVADR